MHNKYVVCKISYSTYFQIKGKDLPGAVNVLPAGLGAVLAKRQSSEFKMEVKMIIFLFAIVKLVLFLVVYVHNVYWSSGLVHK